MRVADRRLHEAFRQLAGRLLGSLGDPTAATARLVVEVARTSLLQSSRAADWVDDSPLASLAEPQAAGTALLRERGACELLDGFCAPAATDPFAVAHLIGGALDLVRSLDSQGTQSGDRQSRRRRSGSYFTPERVARSVVERSTPHLVGPAVPGAGHLRICDPACGGGAFVVEAVRHLVDGRTEPAHLGAVLGGCFAIDRSRLAVETCRLALRSLLAEPRTPSCQSPPSLSDQVVLGDALAPETWEPFRVAEFDWIITNPPWVAYQGRAAQHLEPAVRADYQRRFEAFQGYRTLHALFVEVAVQRAPRGLVSLLLPSSLSDLDGYGAVRRVLRRSHVPLEPLLEYGQDAFEGVVQPCFALIARPRDENGRSEDSALPERPLVLEERQRTGQIQAQSSAPSCLTDLAGLPCLPPECFREQGFQSNRRVSQELFLRSSEPRAPFSEPLLQGRNVTEFSIGPPSLFLHPDEGILSATRCALRDASLYREVDFVVRQTAAFPIAALHDGTRFRNSLIAGYGRQLEPELLVALLNSRLYRALHLSRRRDARQAAFPQVKVSHLRSLPRPPEGPERGKLVELTRRAHDQGHLSAQQRVELDAAVFSLFGLDSSAGEAVVAFVQERHAKA